MSITIDYFFNHQKSLPELAEEMNACLGCSLAPYEGDAQDLFDYFMGMEFSLHSTEGLENDQEMDFENFRYIISFRTPWGNSEARPIQLVTMMCVIYALHRWLGITGMLVYDLQTLLARYEERDIPEYGKSLYDLVSGTTFIQFSEHLGVLKKCFSEEKQAIFC